MGQIQKANLGPNNYRTNRSHIKAVNHLQHNHSDPNRQTHRMCIQSHEALMHFMATLNVRHMPNTQGCTTKHKATG